jgi:hypothetical protein
VKRPLRLVKKEIALVHSILVARIELLLGEFIVESARN